MLQRRLFYNTVLLTCSALVMNCIGMAFQAWLVGRIGSVGIGLYQLTVSVSNLIATFAISGIRFATTRLVSEELGQSNIGGIRSAIRRCMAYALFFGMAAAVILRSLAQPLGFLWVRDARTVLSLRIAAYSMPCISLCAALSGYFTACGRVWKPTLVHLIEQIAGIFLVSVFLQQVPLGDVEKSCAAVTLGRLLADLLSLLLMLLFYWDDRVRHYGTEVGGKRITSRMLRIAMPLAVSAYARSALSTLQHLLVPRGLRAAGYSSDGALSGYGTVHGMALPIVFFPSCLLAAAAELIVPELTEAQMRNDMRSIRRHTKLLLRMGLRFSLLTAAFLFVFSDRLGQVVYHSGDVGHYIRILAPLVPIIYIDMIVDGCLKGMGQQMWSMGINILDALLGLLLVIVLLPRYGLPAYLGILYLTELVNFVLSAQRLRRCLKDSA